MRFHLKKIVTWSLSVLLFLAFTFNFYNRAIWLPSANSGPFTLVANINAKGEKVTPRNVINKLAITEEAVPQIRNVTAAAETVTVSSKTDKTVVWPDKQFYDNDRIVNQLKYKPTTNSELSNSTVPLKLILVNSGLGSQAKRGRDTFLDQSCLVNTCELTDRRDQAEKADAILFHHSAQKPWTTRPLNQIWILFMLESPYHTPGLRAFNSVYNWTATYRHDSDIVAPYEKFVPFDENVPFLPQNKSYAAGKTKQVAWFVSNCGARNTRKEYANELGKFIGVDIYGSCGKLKCPRRDKKCFEMLNTDYKFYLSFENSNCRDYITEKFFVTGLQHDVIPIVMGGAPEDYARAAPPHSFIHVDDFESPEQLAQYLHKLDQNDDLYNEYFRWKHTGSFINTFFWCRICAMLHETTRESHSYRDLEKWWRGEEVCIGKDSWRKRQRTSKFIVQDYLD